MRRYLLAVLLALACAAHAHAQAPKPPELQPIPEPPPPPPGVALDPTLEPEVTIVKRGIDTVEEYRIAGRLYMMKVIPPSGKPYYLIDHRGDGTFTRQESFDFGLRVPMWVIHSF
jgi:hypothetical protein